MATPDRVVNVRFINGINRQSDSRIADPGSWWGTDDMYGATPSQLVQRPGSALVVNGMNATAAIPEGAPGTYVPNPGTYPTLPATPNGGIIAPMVVSTALAPATSFLNFYSSTDDFGIRLAGEGHWAVHLQGAYGLVPQINPIVFPPWDYPVSNNKLQVGIKSIKGLARIYMDAGKGYWIGAMACEGGYPDTLFYIAADQPNTAYIMMTNLGQANITTSGADFFFVPFRSAVVNSEGESNTSQNYWAIATNGTNAPIGFTAGNSNHPFRVLSKSLAVMKDTDYPADADTIPTSVALGKLYGAKAICVYQGSMVYAGFRMKSADEVVNPLTHVVTTPATVDQDWTNYVCFSVPGEPHRLSTNEAGVLNTVQIGASIAEPCTAAIVTSIPTDSQGIKAQLLVFTARKIVAFDGFPPVTGDALGQNFTSTVLDDMGCISPRTVVRTPMGVVFLGTDGHVYLQSGLQGPQRIGNAVEAFFVGMDQRHKKFVSAYWDRDGFYKMSFAGAGDSQSGTQTYTGRLGGAGGAKYDYIVPVIPDTQLWADMRYLEQGKPDLGVKWYGPMTGMQHSCFATAFGVEDPGTTYAGSAIDGSIFEVNRYDKLTDPMPTLPTTDVYVRPKCTTNLFDMGDAHVDKTISALAFGVATTKELDVTSRIIVNGDSNCLVADQSFVDNVAPCDATFGDTTLFGDATTLNSEDNFHVLEKRPPGRMRGKTFRFQFDFEDGAGAKVALFDLGFRAIVAPRRG